MLLAKRPPLRTAKWPLSKTILGIIAAALTRIRFSPSVFGSIAHCAPLVPTWHCQVLALRNWELLGKVLEVSTFQHRYIEEGYYRFSLWKQYK